MAELSQDLELHDRIIVASANLLGAVLITKDEVIRQAGHVQTAW
jgi:PIN domain nuclease of toxin-antitoxin system